MSEWQPIESAPKDGRFILLHCPDGQLESGAVTVGAYWKEDERADNGRFKKGHWDGWLGMDVDIVSSWCEPTHWMPLPEPPVNPSQNMEDHVFEPMEGAIECAACGGLPSEHPDLP